MLNKKAQLIVDKTMAIILAILVIILVAGIFFYFNPNFLYNLLPNYNSPSETGDEEIEGADALTSTCSANEVLVARIGSSGNAREAPIYLGEDSKDKSSLYYKKTGADTADLVLYTKRSFDDIDGKIIVGRVSSNQVTIFSEYLESLNPIYTKNLFSDSPFYLNPKELSYLEGSFLKGYAYFCKNSSDLISSNFHPRYFESSNIHLSPTLSVVHNSFLFLFQKEFCRIDLDPYVYCSSISTCNDEYLFLKKSSENTFKIYLSSKHDGNVLLFSVANDGSVWFNEDIGLSGSPPNINDFRALDWRVDSAKGFKFGTQNYDGFRETSLVLDKLYESFQSTCSF